MKGNHRRMLYMAERTVLAKRHDQIFKKPKRGQDSSLGNVFCGNGNLMIPLTGSPLCLALFFAWLPFYFLLCLALSHCVWDLLLCWALSSAWPRFCLFRSSPLPCRLHCQVLFSAWPPSLPGPFSAWSSSLPGPLLCMVLFSMLSFLLPDTFF
jgi:hypothetical protein